MATVAIAFLTGANRALSKNTLKLTKATHELNKAIKTSADQHQEDMKKLYISLTAAQLYAASTNPLGRTFEPEKLEKFKGIVASGL